jgi:phenylalanyl-tRNA synthetase alpha chain
MSEESVPIEEAQALAAVEQAESLEALEQVRVAWLGKRGRLTEALRGLGRLPAERRREEGQRLNALRTQLEESLRLKAEALEAETVRRRIEAERLDLTLPGRRPAWGRIHPVTAVRRQLEQVMVRLGFSTVYGPDIETEWYNFQALNMPADHPAREMHDTFYLQSGLVLRTHTSPVQIRAMQAAGGRPPVRIVTTGTCFRRDDDATHLPQFVQMEGLLVDEGVSLADLKGVVRAVLQEVFGAAVDMRLRPSYFPFTEPSAEVDMRCVLCGGVGCRVCKETGWLEILGSGMVHPKVLEAGGFDPERVSGFAFGWGIERVAMLLYGIDDIRLLYQNDVRFLERFDRV